MSEARAHSASGRAAPATLCRVAIGSGIAVFVLLQAVAWRVAGGFEYPLDDVYIHLAVAEQIAAGGYGVNAGEVSSPASSPLYPLLLVPFAGAPAQAWLPLVWNVAGLVASAWFFGRIVMQAGLPDRIGLVLALVGPVALNMAGLAAVGMEHSLHMAASLAIVSGLIDAMRDGRVTAPLLAGLFFAPAMRPEGVALALLAAAAVSVRLPRMAPLVVALAALPQLAFASFLASLGLDPLPSSVLTKLDSGPGEGLLGGLVANLSQPVGALLAAAVMLSVPAGISAWRSGRRDAAAVAAVTALAGAAHLALGQLGWLNRYEPYALASVAAGLIYAVAATGATVKPVLAGAGALVLAGAAFHYVTTGTTMLIASPSAVKLQHGEMARFAKDHLRAPVAVNDLGYVAWANPNAVLDLWGLASAQAREIRLGDPAPGWAGPLADAAGVEAAMIYDHWLASAAGPDWVRLGTFDLMMNIEDIAVGGRRVTFYATDPRDAGRISALLADWAQTLPERTLFTPEPPAPAQPETTEPSQ